MDASLRTGMYKTPYKGFVTTYSYDQKGNLLKAPATVYTFKNGALTPILGM